MQSKKKKTMTPKDKNKLAKKFVANRLSEKISLDGDMLKTWSSSTKNTPELLVTSADRKKTVLLHVQYSRTYPKDYPCRTSGWHDVSVHVLENTNADFFVFVCAPTKGKATAAKCEYVIIEKSILQARLQNNDSKGQNFVHIYLTTIRNSAVDTRGLGRLRGHRTQGEIPEDIQKVMEDETSPKNFTKYLNNWMSIKEFLVNAGTESNP